MVFATGDTHGNWMGRLRMESFPEQKEMTKEDYVIICGDFGIWDNSKKEKYNLDWLEGRSFNTLFVCGNHENFDILDAMPVSVWNGGKVHLVRPSVIHLMRGQVFTLEGRKFFTFGGASSHDIKDGILEPKDPFFKVKKRELDRNPDALYRINHVNWWARELPDEAEMSEGLANLEKAGNRVDYIITHSPYSSMLPRMDGGTGLYKSDILADYLQGIRDTVEYRHWLFGHMHENKTWPEEKSSCLFEQIVKIL